MVGEKLASLGQRFQVLCITHLPQIAACGRTHFLIEKRDARPPDRHQRLEADWRGDRVDELARMMGGADAGAHARAGAQELLGRGEGER